MEQIIVNKDAELIATHQLDVQLLERVRELEKSLEADTTEPII